MDRPRFARLALALAQCLHLYCEEEFFFGLVGIVPATADCQCLVTGRYAASGDDLQGHAPAIQETGRHIG